jgi:hypothetical protein
LYEDFIQENHCPKVKLSVVLISLEDQEVNMAEFKPSENVKENA